MELAETESSIVALFSPLAAELDAQVEEVRLRERENELSLEVTVDSVDGTESLSLDQVAELSRVFSDALDQEDPVSGAYSLEVGTPGAESELKTLRHYQRNLGRTLRVKLRDGEKFEGTLTGVSATSFALATDQGSKEIEFSQVRKARPRVTFG